MSIVNLPKDARRKEALAQLHRLVPDLTMGAVIFTHAETDVKKETANATSKIFCNSYSIFSY